MNCNWLQIKNCRRQKKLVWKLFKLLRPFFFFFVFIQPEKMTFVYSCHTFSAWWHIRCSFSSSSRRVEPLDFWPMHWCMAVSVYSQLCALVRLTVCPGSRVWWMEVEGEISRVHSWYKNQHNGGGVKGWLTLSPPRLPPSFMYTLLSLSHPL